MKFTNMDLVKYLNKLSSFIEKDLTMPTKISYFITKNFEAMANAVKPYEKERLKLIERYKINELATNVPDFEREMNELLDIEIDVDIAEVSFSELEECGLSPKDMLSFNFMIKD